MVAERAVVEDAVRSGGEVVKVAVVGGGPLAAAQWAVRFLARGWDVEVSDAKVPDLAAGLWAESQFLGHFPGASLDRLTVRHVRNVGEVDYVHDVDGPARGTAPIHILPFVEILAQGVGGVESWAVADIYRDIGMLPVLVRHSTADVVPKERVAALCSAVVDPAEADLAIGHGPGLQLLAGSDPGALVAVMRSMRPFGRGAGRLLADWEDRRFGTGAVRWTPDVEVPTPLALYHALCEPDWVDYNGHMTEAAYLTAFGWASDALFRYIGDDEAYREAGHSFYTVETHIDYLQEVSVNEPLTFTTHVLGVDRKRLWFHHSMYHGDSGALLSTTEQMLVHVDMHAGRSAPILPSVRQALDAIAAAHSTIPRPATAGCFFLEPN